MTETDSFASIKEWLDGLPDQTEGIAGRICQTGEPYVEFFASAIARPDDCEAVERNVAKLFRCYLEQYFSDRKGIIYWRERFESHVSDHQEVIRYDAFGPDVDPITNRQCYADRNWKRLAVYCRLYRARHLHKIKPGE